MRPIISIILFAILLALSLPAAFSQDSTRLDRTPRLEVRPAITDYIAALRTTAPPDWLKFRGVIIEKKLVSELYPLLTTLFFDRGEVKLPERFELFTHPDLVRNFYDSAVPGGTLQKYRHVLNIIGYRMTQNPHTKIRIIGGYSKEGGETREIAEERARIILEYLINIWHIDPSRMKISPVDEPYGNRSDTMLQAELRCAHIESDNWEIARPLYTREVREFPSPEFFELYIDPMTPPENIRSCTIKMFWKDKLQHSLEFPWHPDSTRVTTLWNWLEQNPDSIPSDEKSVHLKATITTHDGGKVVSAVVEIPVRTVERPPSRDYNSPTRIDRFTILMFPRGKSEIDNVQERIIRIYIADWNPIIAESDIHITGYCDPDENDKKFKLSTARAKGVKESLLKNLRIPPTQPIEYEGVGSKEPLYSNDLPEGRCYNRTVQVVIETPWPPPEGR